MPGSRVYFREKIQKKRERERLQSALRKQLNPTYWFFLFPNKSYDFSIGYGNTKITEGKHEAKKIFFYTVYLFLLFFPYAGTREGGLIIWNYLLWKGKLSKVEIERQPISMGLQSCEHVWFCLASHKGPKELQEKRNRKKDFVFKWLATTYYKIDLKSHTREYRRM